MGILKTLTTIAFLSIGASCAHAQTSPDTPFPELTGVMQIELATFPPISDDAPACGITEKLLHDGFMQAARSARFKVVEPGSGVDFHKAVMFEIDTDTARASGICASSIDVRVQHNQEVNLEYSGRKSRVDVLLFSDHQVTLSGVTEHGLRVKQSVAIMVKAFITAWDSANK
jgi:hypothetical protein